MKQLVWVCVVCSILQATGLASPPKGLVSELTGAQLGRGVTSVKKLPVPLKLALAQTFVQRRLDLGDPSQPIGNEILIAGDPQYPQRRLLFAFETQRYYVAYVEYGPPAVHASALVFEKTKAQPSRLVWGGVDLRMPPFAASPNELAKQILAGKLREGRFIW